MSRSRKTSVLYILTCSLILPGSAWAQNVWLEPSHGNEIRFEAYRPNFKDTDFSPLSMLWFISGTYEQSQTLSFHVEIPYANFSSDDFEISSSTLGNPYVGMNYGHRESGFMVEAGIRAPYASKEEAASMMGWLSDKLDRPEAFIPELFSATLGGNYRYRSAQGFAMKLRVAPILWLDGADILPDPAEAWVAYSAQGMYLSGPVAFGGGFSGRYWVTDNNGGDFGESSLHEFDLFVNLEYGHVKPSLRVRIPVDNDLTDYLGPSVVLGLGVAMY